MIFYRKQQAGFSLVETLVAVSILLIVITGPMTITSRTAKSSSFATEQAQAFFLAQEGLELAQLVRDRFMLDHFNGTEPNPWTSFSQPGGNFTRCYLLSNGCGLDWTTVNAASMPECTNDTVCKLHYRNTNERDQFTHTSGGGSTETLYERRVFLTYEAASPERVTARAEVRWRTGSLITTQRVVVETYLYNVYGL